MVLKRSETVKSIHENGHATSQERSSQNTGKLNGKRLRFEIERKTVVSVKMFGMVNLRNSILVFWRKFKKRIQN
jgi:hypothetical protein